MSEEDDRERDNRSGRYTTEFELDAFVEAVKELELPSTQDIADEVGCSYDLAYRRLQQLENEDEVRKEKIGGSFVYFTT